MRVAALLLLGPIVLVVLRGPISDRLFTDGEGGAPLSLDGSGVGGAALPPAERTRVVLIDGLGFDAAKHRMVFGGYCSSGFDLVVDVGFPTVSLPIQHALWTGLTQQQSGVVLDNDGLDASPPYAFPARVPGSISVSESHREMASSFGFEKSLPASALSGDAELDWKLGGFIAESRRAVASDAKLVFVHTLKVDEAGHLHGSDSAEYHEASAMDDDLISELVDSERLAALERAEVPARWFVLSDHGHLAAGGHRGAEPEVRFVRACIFGGGIEPGRARTGRIHLIDLSRALAESLGLGLHPTAQGRSLTVAIANPEPDATLPRSTRGGWGFAVLLTVIGLAVTLFAAGAHRLLWPWWLPLGFGVIVVAVGVPTLSNWKSIPWWAVAPGLLLCAIQTALSLRGATVMRIAVAQLALPVAVTGGALAVCGAWARLLGISDASPVIPYWTASAGVMVALCAATAASIGITVSALYLVRVARFTRTAPESSSSNATPSPP